MALAANVPAYLRNLNDLLDFLIDKFHVDKEIVSQLGMTYKEIVQTLTAAVTAAAPQLLNFSMALGNGVVTGLTALISSIYMLAGKDKLIFQLKKVVYALMPTPRARRFLSVCDHANRVFAGFINGKLIDSAIIGVLCFVCMSLLRMPLALLISTVVGVTNVIPFFGPALWFGILIILLQQFDGNILGPKILGDSTGLSAIWVLVAIIVGGGLFGFAGMLLGVPAFAVLYSLSSDFIAARLAARGVDAAGEPARPAGEKTDEKTEEERAQ